MNYCVKCGKPTNNGIMCEDCIISGSPWLLAMKSKEDDLVEQNEKLKSENAELRARLEKAVELPRIIHPNPVEWHIQYQYESGIIDSDIRFSEAKAEARLKELQGGER